MGRRYRQDRPSATSGNTGHNFGAHLHFEVTTTETPSIPSATCSHDAQASAASTMAAVSTVFDVLNAGCSSCAEKVRAVLSPLGAVEAIVVDEAADTATVRLVAPADLTRSEVDDVLELASAGGGHAYRVKPGSWRVEAE